MSNLSDANPISGKFMAAIISAVKGDDKQAAELLRQIAEDMTKATRSRPASAKK